MSTAAADAFERKPKNATDVTAFVDGRMYQWARFARDRLSSLGYPRESISTKLLREIVLGINSPSGYCPDVTWPQDVAVVERCLNTLCRGRSHWAHLVEVTYLTPRDEPNEARARRLGVTKWQYEKLLGRFRNAMFGALLMQDGDIRETA